MSATLTHPSIAAAPTMRSLRFGVSSDADKGSVQWLLKRNCSTTPRQMMGLYASLCVLSLAIGSFFWAQGAKLVMPFAWLEMLAVGAALCVYSRHVSDSERISLQAGRLTVENGFGHHTERVEFSTAWVRIEPRHGEHSLIELSGQGRSIAVGRYVRPEQRRQLAEELRWALRRWHGAAPEAALEAESPAAPPPGMQDKFEN